MTHLCVSKLTSIASNNGLSPGRQQAIIWNNAGNFVNWTLRNKLQWNFNRNSHIFIEENTFENVVCEMSVILSRPQCVNVSISLVLFWCSFPRCSATRCCATHEINTNKLSGNAWWIKSSNPPAKTLSFIRIPFVVALRNKSAKIPSIVFSLHRSKIIDCIIIKHFAESNIYSDKPVFAFNIPIY